MDPPLSFFYLSVTNFSGLLSRAREELSMQRNFFTRLVTVDTQASFTFYSLAGTKAAEEGGGGGGEGGGGGAEDGEGIKQTRERGGATPSVLGCDWLTDRKRW